VGVCEPDEVPQTWRGGTGVGWDDGTGSEDVDHCDSVLDQSQNFDAVEQPPSPSDSNYLQRLRASAIHDQGEFCFMSLSLSISTLVTNFMLSVDDWTDMPENDDFSPGVFVNLLHNPERYTGYAGPNARRVWSSIMEDNCFGGEDDGLLERRVFYR